MSQLDQFVAALESILHHVEDGILIADDEQNLLYHNQLFRDLLSIPKDKPLQHMSDLEGLNLKKELLRAAIDASEMSRYRIAVEAEMDHASMSRFMSGKTGLTLDTIDRLAEVLGLEMVSKRRGVRKAKNGR